MSKKLLIIEDDIAEITMIKHTLKGLWDGDLEFAQSAEEAREKLAQSNETDKIELIILDLNLPGTGGLDFLMELRSNYPKIPVTISTGSKRREDLLQALRIGAVDFIEKPLTTERLEACLTKIRKTQSAQFSVSIVDSNLDIKSFAEIEKDIIKKALDFNNGNISKTASDLGITRATLYKKIE